MLLNGFCDCVGVAVERVAVLQGGTGREKLKSELSQAHMHRAPWLLHTVLFYRMGCSAPSLIGLPLIHPGEEPHQRGQQESTSFVLERMDEEIRQLSLPIPGKPSPTSAVGPS
jgi:hypothetical protein